MALQTDIKMSGGVRVAGAYLMVNNARCDKLSGRVMFSLVAYVDEARRREHGRLLAAQVAGDQRVGAAVQAVNALLAAKPAEEPDADKALAAKAVRDRALRTAQTEVIMAKAEAEAANLELQAGDCAPFWQADDATLNAATSAEAAPGGVIDLAKLYAVVKRERFPGAVDLV